MSQAAEPTAGAVLPTAAGAVAIALLVTFVVAERRATAPLIPRGLHRTVRSADTASLTVLAAPFGFSFVATLYLQDVLGWRPLGAGLALLPGAVLSIVVSRWVAPGLVNPFGLRTAGVAGLLLVAAGFALLVRLGPGADYACRGCPQVT